MTSQHCSRKNAPESATNAAAPALGIWILLNALTSAYVASHIDSPGVRQFLERLNATNPPTLSDHIDEFAPLVR